MGRRRVVCALRSVPPQAHHRGDGDARPVFRRAPARRDRRPGEHRRNVGLGASQAMKPSAPLVCIHPLPRKTLFEFLAEHNLRLDVREQRDDKGEEFWIASLTPPVFRGSGSEISGFSDSLRTMGPWSAVSNLCVLLSNRRSFIEHPCGKSIETCTVTPPLDGELWRAAEYKV